MRFALKDINLTKVAECLRSRVEERIRASGRWNKTGHLMESLKVQAGSSGLVAVTVASDRLKSAELMQKFQDEIVPHDLDGPTLGAIGDTVRGAIEIKATK
jgi:hypothetical protein